MHRRMSSFREYKFFRSFSAKIENWHIRKAESLWKRMRERKLAEIEAIEACRWLRAAGFPQYAQMYEDHQFPIEINDVAKDHPFLENDPLQSLYRRLQTLNRCANMHIDTHQHSHPPKPSEDSDDDSCALSEAWTFAHNSRRWSRVEDAAGLVSVIKQKHSNNKSDVSTVNETDSAEDSSKSGSKTTTDDKESWGEDGLTLNLLSDSDQQDGSVRLRRTGSERLKDGAKALLRRVESIKSRRRKRQNRDGLIICGPHSSSLSPAHHALDDLKHIDVISLSNPSSPRSSTPHGNHRRDNNTLGTNEIVSNLLSPYTLSPFGHMVEDKQKEPKRSPNRSSPLHFFIQLQEAKSGDDSSSICSEDSQDLNTGYFAGRIVKTPSKKYPKAKKLLRHKVTADDSGALSDSEYQSKLRRSKVTSDLKETTNSNTLQVSKLNRGGSLNLGKGSKRYRDAFHNRSMRVTKTHEEKAAGEERKRPTVARWHSFQQPKNSDGRRISVVNITDNSKEKTNYSRGTSICEMSCGQLLVVRKLALVTLTGYMERYCPTHRSGWNWDLPKFIKRIKTPDYKDRRIFGVPLVLNLQRYGNTLPEIIQMALSWLEVNALDQVGLFRKPGVKSRIAKLKTTLEGGNNAFNRMAVFDDYHAYDVADMLKQYFRELPDPLLTAKLSETFVAIFQYLPEEVRMEAVQSSILLLPDEHREVLYALLDFLSKVVASASQNQMTANNLSVCLAPSLFYSISGNRSSTASPRRKKGAIGQPDEKELSETRASHDCLCFLIQHYRTLWTISSDRMRKCSFNYMEESKPVPLESLGAELHVQNWRGYLTECIKECVREGKERPRGWVSLNSSDPSVSVHFKKVGDGHPLRLWKTVTEVEAPPTEVINHILNERHLWDDHLLKAKIVERLDDDTDVYQYVCGQPVTDYCVLRQWNKQQSRGACVIVEVSISHNGAQPLLDGVRGVVLASRYLIEPCGSGKCKLMHLSRVDMKGRTPDWYNKNYGHICQQYLSRIKKFFEHNTEGPESKV
ncbi:rho GTPase-activating protein 7 isoform X2 [Wyeomyia smithii]|uniref:rho GTPase-activating protein 7 isoform X2 n=1 Tax=Wyeomyia smithii TaxID=174621 RepID=UPI002467CE26|nr:rho GTPase-activating protein 7 isoform X2 [Wyeomyia smithii]